MGVEHGAYCLGCCWFLMGLLFVGGIMNAEPLIVWNTITLFLAGAVLIMKLKYNKKPDSSPSVAAQALRSE